MKSAPSERHRPLNWVQPASLNNVAERSLGIHPYWSERWPWAREAGSWERKWGVGFSVDRSVSFLTVMQIYGKWSEREAARHVESQPNLGSGQLSWSFWCLFTRWGKIAWLVIDAFSFKSWGGRLNCLACSARGISHRMGSVWPVESRPSTRDLAATSSCGDHSYLCPLAGTHLSFWHWGTPRSS